MDGVRADTPGTMIVVVGPSGAGKDSVIAFALRGLRAARSVHLVRRVITRPADAGGEDHDSVSPAQFDTLRAEGAFAVAWEAHGLKYGIPQDTVSRLKSGDILIANGSRAALDQFRRVFPDIVVVQITALPEVLAERLAMRGRECEADIRRRLERQAPDLPAGDDVITIDNSGPLEIAGARFAALIAHLAGGGPAPC